ncbi:DNA adenine methylase [Candidatus Woesearchaeota archaeon]|nr:DNA adenine methylase [Candidatus Woesearchaeota archaeon]
MSKDDKIYEEYSINFDLKSNSREKLRKETVDKFLSEKGGYWKDGKKYVTRYKYYVENLKDGRRIFLLRPTFLNKGIDFQVWVEKMDGVEDKRPSHKDVFREIEIKKKENPKDFAILMKAIDEVWNCSEPDDVLKTRKMIFKEGFQVEMLLKILKWLFIEQDITYWNYDGRGMLKLAIEEKAKL